MFVCFTFISGPIVSITGFSRQLFAQYVAVAFSTLVLKFFQDTDEWSAGKSILRTEICRSCESHSLSLDQHSGIHVRLCRDFK